jgi:hypothetical protein
LAPGHYETFLIFSDGGNFEHGEQVCGRHNGHILRRSEAKNVNYFLDENSGTIATKCSNEIWTDKLNSTIQQNHDKKGDGKDYCESYNLTAKQPKEIGVNDKSLFSLSLILRTSKLECLASPARSNRSLLMREHPKGAPLA